MSKWQAVVFDLDDTLYLERDYVLSGMHAVATWIHATFRFPIARSYDELRRLFEEGVRGDTFNRWLAHHGLAPNVYVPAMVAVYRCHRPRITPHRDTGAILIALRDRYRLGLVTDGYLDVQRRKVAALGLATRLDAIVYSDAFGREHWKPSHRPFEAVLQRLGVAPPSAVYIGDNPTKDFRGARELGMSTIRIRYPNGLDRFVVDDRPGRHRRGAQRRAPVERERRREDWCLLHG